MDKWSTFWETLFKKNISRKDFVRLLLSLFALLPFLGRDFSYLFANTPKGNGRKKRRLQARHDLVVLKGDDPYQMTVKAIDEMGGMSRFVKRGSTVVVKPNIAWDRTPQQAANTNPAVVAALVELCMKAGARRVKVFDITCNDTKSCYASSGIEKAALEKGAEVFFPDQWNVIKARFDYETPMHEWPIFRDAIECDTFINVPVLKHHGLTGLTLSMKNLMGVCAGNRGLIHQDIGRKLVDLTAFINPELTVIDAFRVLIRNGPTGGNLADVIEKRTILVSTDPTLADYYACTLVDVDPSSLPNVNYALRHNFGITDVHTADILELEG